MMPPCDLPVEDLVAYAEGALRGGRKELVEAHLAACPACRERLAAFHQVDRLLRGLREGLPAGDEAAGRAALLARLDREASRPARPPVPRVLLSVLLLGLAVLLLLAWPAISQARPGLGRFIRFTVAPAQEGLPPGAGPPGTPLVGVQPAQPGTPPPGLEPVEPAALPLGLALGDRSTLPSGRRELLYRNQRGLTILLTQEPAEGTRQRVAGGSPETVVVGDTEVLWLRWPRTEAVAQLSWERRGVLFQVIVLEAPAGGLPLAEARQLVEVLIAAQEAAR